ncbi:MAG: pyridoxal phosphate-dependent aminotransferase [Tractidigestivibacter sp.]|jgi:aspartate/methionine/tyrosine aminotransferase|uniref:pyridoxal phosphate-dependent aminotransferase n=1 Tax=Tractidigestivibacter sp. TaxID=2847320 RepID=UPI003D8BDFBD
MTRPLNTALDGLRLSPIRRFSDLAKSTPGCVSLTLGEPGENTPDAVSAHVGADLAAHLTHYPPNNGYPFLKEAISGWEAKRGLSYAPDQLIVTDGATEALMCALTIVLNPGDEAIIPTPAFLLYDSLVRLNRATPVALDTTPDGFQVRRDRLEAALTPATKAIVVTSPNNPTGCVLDDQSMDALADAAIEHDLYVICDDVYSELAYKSGYRRLLVAHPELRERAVVVQSFSKPWAMTGWRLGWAESTPELISAMAKVHQYAVSSVPAFLQHAAVEALRTDTTPMRESYRRRRDVTLKALEEMGLPVTRPEGAFYAFPDIRGLGLSSEDFCERAIREAGVALVPGTAFGAEGFARLSYACDKDTLRLGLERLSGFVSTLG